MKIKSIWAFLLLAFPFGLFLSSCKKAESTISGRATYIGAVSGIEYKASGALIYLYMGAAGQTGGYSQKTTADPDGNYSFDYLLGGPWSVSGTITVNGIHYSGQSQPVDVNGKNSKTLNLRME